jgi:hypothetical protein
MSEFPRGGRSHGRYRTRDAAPKPFYRPAAQNENLAPVLPHSDEAETALLGAIIVQGKVPETVLAKLKPEEYFHTQNQRLYREMIVLTEAQQAIDLVTLPEQLDRVGMLESVGGAAYVAALIDGVPHVSNVEHYMRIVKEKYVLRGLIHATQAIQQTAFDGDDAVDAILDRAEKKLSEIRAYSDTAVNWRKRFHTVEELPEGEPVMPITGILPEGVTFWGANSGLGKTWLALAQARALITGRKFLGVWDVAEPVNVLYLCPEMSSRSFKKRCKRFGIGGPRFRCMTISDGVALNLSDPLLLAAIRELKPVIFLDTAIRFSSAEDENSASDNAKGLGPAIFALIHAGARAVVCLHHRAKGASLAEELTLENCLRGTTDLGALCDAVYGLQLDRGDGSPGYLRESKKNVRLLVRCVKARDFRAPEDFRVQLDPFINEIGDMAVVTEESNWTSDAEKVEQAIVANLQASLREIEKHTNVDKDRVKKLAGERGWYQDKTDGWKKKEPGPRASARADV